MLIISMSPGIKPVVYDNVAHANMWEFHKETYKFQSTERSYGINKFHHGSSLRERERERE